MSEKKIKSLWAWIPSLYFAEGIPYIIVMSLSVVMYKRLGISNSDIALYTSWLYLPWVIKPFWSPMVDILKTKRFWITTMQLVIGAGLAAVAFTIPVPAFFQYSLAVFWLLAFSSATHDIAADGFYMLALDSGNQAWWVGIRSTFYRLAMLTGQGLLVILAGSIESSTGPEPIYITVDANNQHTFITSLDSTKIFNSTHSEGFSFTEKVQQGLTPVTKTKADSVIALAKAWNTSHNFYEAEAVKKSETKKESLWKRNISIPLGDYIKKHFGEEIILNKTNISKPVSVAWIKLSESPKPGDEIVVNFSRDKGTKDIGIVEGTRFVFTSENWQQPACIVFMPDAKLTTEANTVFVGRSGNIKLAWMISLLVIAALFIAFSFYHRLVLPKPESDKPAITAPGSNVFKEFWIALSSYFTRKNILVVLSFLLFYRFAESQLVKLASPFLLDSTEMGGLGLTTGNLGLVYGTIGIIALSLGGIIGGILVSRNGLKYWFWWMIAAMNIPHLAYVYLSWAMPSDIWIIAANVAFEQLGYGFGFTAYMVYMLYTAQGKHQTSHFAISTGFMALGMMIPGMLSGWLQDIIGYHNFFIWVLICGIPGILVGLFVKIDPEFGKKKKEISESK